MNILIKNGHLVDPSQGIDGIYDVLVSKGKIQELKPHATKGKDRKPAKNISERKTEELD